jgi:DNA-binding LytR/AlgR family response regulator
MKEKLLIVEDEFSIAMDMKMRLEKMGYAVMEICVSYEEALLSLAEEKPSLVLMDINLNKDKNGIDVAEKVHKTFDLPVVFVTAFSDRATFEKAMSTRPFGYVVKPFKDTDLDNAIRIALAQHQTLSDKNTEINFLKNAAPATVKTSAQEEAHIFVKVKGQLEKVFVNDFIFLEALDNYTNIYTTQKKYTINAFLKDLHQQLPEEKFMRIHRSYVVNVDAIKSIDDNLLYLKNNTSIPISKSYRSEFMNRIKIIS